MMIRVGMVCKKVAGRDAGKIGVVLHLDKTQVLLDGFVRRRLCGLSHIVPLGQEVKLKQNASHDDVVKALTGLGYTFPATKTRVHERKSRPLKKRVLAVQERVAQKVKVTKKEARTRKKQ